MSDHIFKNIATENSMKEAHNNLYNPRKDNEELKRKIEVVNPILNDLTFLSQKVLFSIKDSKDKRSLDEIKKEFDKVAFMLNKTVKDFEGLYEEVFALHTAEKLQGTFDSVPLSSQTAFATSAKSSKSRTVTSSINTASIGNISDDDDLFI